MGSQLARKPEHNLSDRVLKLRRVGYDGGRWEGAATDSRRLGFDQVCGQDPERRAGLVALDKVSHLRLTLTVSGTGPT